MFHFLQRVNMGEILKAVFCKAKLVLSCIKFTGVSKVKEFYSNDLNFIWLFSC